MQYIVNANMTTSLSANGPVYYLNKSIFHALWCIPSVPTKMLAVISHRSEKGSLIPVKISQLLHSHMAKVDLNDRPGTLHTALLWPKCLHSDLTTQTQTVIYLNPTHGQPVCSCVCVVGGNAIHSVNNWQICPRRQLFPGYQDIFPVCSRIIFFHSAILYWQNAVHSDMQHAFCAPVTNEEKWAAWSQGGPHCLAGQKQQEQQEHKKQQTATSQNVCN